MRGIVGLLSFEMTVVAADMISSVVTAVLTIDACRFPEQLLEFLSTYNSQIVNDISLPGCVVQKYSKLFYDGFFLTKS